MEDPDLPEEESPGKLLLRKIYLIIVAIFLVSLFLVNTNAGYHLVSVISGKIVSSTLDINRFQLKESGQVILQNNTYSQLKDLWYANQEHEFKACLTGYKQDNNYIVTGVYIPKIYAQDVFSVTSAGCDSNTIVSLHSHPPLRCIFSEQDIRSYEQRVNPESIIALMCDVDRLSFYGY